VTVIDRIRGELVGLGLTESGANNLLRYSILRYVTQLADTHNDGHDGYPTGNVLDAPGEDVIEQVPDEHRAAAGTIMLALVQVGRTASKGLCNPEVTLPLRYAAEMVLFAIRCAHNTEVAR
jgi:hypothetical protein